MGTHYLIDYENGVDERLVGTNTLKSSDYIHIFYTENAPNIKINTLTVIFEKIGKKPNFYPVSKGKESLDKHLLAYLGYLIGQHGNKDSYCIISKDKGYESIINFLKEETNTNIIRKENIASNTKNTEKGSSKQTPKDKSNTSEQENKNTTSAQAKNNNKYTEQHKQIYYDLSHDQSFIDLWEEYKESPRDMANYIADLVEEYQNKESPLKKLHNQLDQEYDNGKEIYKVIRPIIKPYFE